MSAHVISIVGEDLYSVAFTGIPSSFAASISIEALRKPVEAISCNLGRRSKNLSWEWSSLPHYANDVIGQKPVDKSGWISNVVVKNSDLCPP